jgi:hypothetical protein
VLKDAGLDTGLLVPWATVEIEASPHRSDKKKAWVDSLTVSR